MRIKTSVQELRGPLRLVKLFCFYGLLKRCVHSVFMVYVYIPIYNLTGRTVVIVGYLLDPPFIFFPSHLCTLLLVSFP